MRFHRIVLGLTLAWLVVHGALEGAEKEATKYVRFQCGDVVSYGVLEGDQIRKIDGDLFGKWTRGSRTYPTRAVKLLVPSPHPSKVIATAGNYKSHLGEDRETPEHPKFFFKVPSCLIADGENVVIPNTSHDVHFEAELVIVIGKRATKVSEGRALEYVLGVTCGNDISARYWQRNDGQWWRAKGSDTFGPCGPVIAAGIDYNNLLMQLRLNGEVKQEQSTRDMVHNVAQIVSWASMHVTLEPGDLIYTGTPGKTSTIRPGDVLEVELEKVGVLTNPVVAEK